MFRPLRPPDTVLDDPRARRALAACPMLFAGSALHRAALSALADGDRALAARLFEHAARRYRTELRVESLARLRVHQMLAHLGERGANGPDLERRLAALDRIEAIVPPFAEVSARSLLAAMPAPAPQAAASSAATVEIESSRSLAA